MDLRRGMPVADEAAIHRDGAVVLAETVAMAAARIRKSGLSGSAFSSGSTWARAATYLWRRMSTSAKS